MHCHGSIQVARAKRRSKKIVSESRKRTQSARLPEKECEFDAITIEDRSSLDSSISHSSVLCSCRTERGGEGTPGFETWTKSVAEGRITKDLQGLAKLVRLWEGQMGDPSQQPPSRKDLCDRIIRRHAPHRTSCPRHPLDAMEKECLLCLMGIPSNTIGSSLGLSISAELGSDSDSSSNCDAPESAAPTGISRRAKWRRWNRHALYWQRRIASDIAHYRTLHGSNGWHSKIERNFEAVVEHLTRARAASRKEVTEPHSHQQPLNAPLLSDDSQESGSESGGEDRGRSPPPPPDSARSSGGWGSWNLSSFSSYPNRLSFGGWGAAALPPPKDSRSRSPTPPREEGVTPRRPAARQFNQDHLGVGPRSSRSLSPAQIYPPYNPFTGGRRREAVRMEACATLPSNLFVRNRSEERDPLPGLREIREEEQLLKDRDEETSRLAAAARRLALLRQKKEEIGKLNEDVKEMLKKGEENQQKIDELRDRAAELPKTESRGMLETMRSNKTSLLVGAVGGLCIGGPAGAVAGVALGLNTTLAVTAAAGAGAGIGAHISLKRTDPAASSGLGATGRSSSSPSIFPSTTGQQQGQRQERGRARQRGLPGASEGEAGSSGAGAGGQKRIHHHPQK